MILRNIYKKIPKSAKFILEPIVNKFRKIRDVNLAKHEKPSNFPRFIQLETASFCNSNCLFCPYGSIRANKEYKAMPLETFLRVINECSNYPVETIYLCLMNEPLADKRMPELINHAKEKNPNTKIKLITNGQLLTPLVSKALIGSKLDEIAFSIHGWTEDTYKNVMGIAINKTLENMNNFIKLADRDKIKISMVCVKTNFFTKKDYYLGFNFCKRNNIDFELGELLNMAGNVNAILAEKIGIEKVVRKEIKGCRFGWPINSMHILHDGGVVACCMDWRREVNLGNINDNSLFEIWNGQAYKDFRDKVYSEKISATNFICKRCSAAF